MFFCFSLIFALLVATLFAHEIRQHLEPLALASFNSRVKNVLGYSFDEEWRGGMTNASCKSDTDAPLFVLLISEAGRDSSTLLFELGTFSRWGHVGIVFYSSKASEWQIAHATPGKARIQTVTTFLQEYASISQHSKMFEYALAMVDTPTSTEIIGAIESWVSEGIAYNNRFSLKYGSRKVMCCSEFVFRLFGEHGIKMGEVETLANSCNLNAKPSLYPDTLGKQLIQRLGLEPDDPLVTPVSILWSRAISKIVDFTSSSLSPLSEIEILDAWTNAIGPSCTGNSQVLSSMGAQYRSKFSNECKISSFRSALSEKVEKSKDAENEPKPKASPGVNNSNGTIPQQAQSERLPSKVDNSSPSLVPYSFSITLVILYSIM